MRTSPPEHGQMGTAFRDGSAYIGVLKLRRRCCARPLIVSICSAPNVEGSSMADTHTPKVKLDWSRLLGFDQTSTTPVDAEAAGRLTDPRLGQIGPKPTKGIRIRR